MNNIAVSILVPVYNTSLYLEKCLNSLINQTLKNIEIVCVNDGSTDNSLEILEAYANKDSRIVVVNKPNGGLPSARNAGIDVAKGEYLGFVDSDDYVSLDMFQKMYATAKKKNSEIVVCGAHIFPEKPKASPWFYDTLSPRKKHYKQFSSDILFKESSARPFLWRNLIKRDLIEREGLRLKEDIVLGEDQAFQFKVFPRAKGITFISDKLYHYCWYREGSIMNSGSSQKFISKFKKHLNLCIHVLDEVQKLKNYAEMRKDTLDWSVDLLYDDFIKLPYSERYYAAKAITAAWNDFGYWNYHNSFRPHINDMFKYFYFIANSSEPKEIDVSIVVNLYNCTNYINDFKASLLHQDLKNFEVIFINNASDNNTYGSIHHWLITDERVRIVNQAYKTRAKTFNTGLELACGKAVIFADAHDVFSTDTIVSDYYNHLLNNNADIVSPHGIKCADDIKSLDAFKLYDFMFNREFLVNNELVFEEYNSLTTKIYALKAFINAEAKSSADSNKPLFRYRSLWRRNWLYKEEAENVLEGYIELLKLSSKAKMASLHLNTVDQLNGDDAIQQILNATSPYVTTPKENPDGENSMSDIFALLCDINAAIDEHLIGEDFVGAYKLISEFVRRKDFFLTHKAQL